MSDFQVVLKDVEKSFPLSTKVKGQDRIPVLRGVRLNLNRGKATAVVGESGCGKTTLAKILMQMEKADAGEVLLNGKSAEEFSQEERRSQFQMVFQDPHASLNPRWSIQRILEEPLIPQGLIREERIAKIIEILKAVGFDESVLNRRVASFSGGQKQRLVIARALLMEPQILICDEPVSALDVSIQGQILNLLARLKTERDLGILFISHDLSVVRAFADEVAILYMGRVVERGPAEIVLSQPRHPYTQLLLNSIPQVEGDWDPFALKESGETPSPLDLGAGCAFQSRCSRVQAKCRAEAPGWTVSDGGGFECFNPE